MMKWLGVYVCLCCSWTRDVVAEGERLLAWTDDKSNVFYIVGEPVDVLQSSVAVESSSYKTHPGPEDHIQSIDFHNARERMFFYSPDSRDIISTEIPTAVQTPVQRLGVPCSDQVTGIAVDWVANNIYWSDATYNWVMMTSLDRPVHHHVILESDLKRPSDVVVHPERSYLFISDSAVPAIVRTSLSGEHRKQLVRAGSGLSMPTSLTLDFVVGRLYWLDIGIGAIKSVDLEGRDPDTLEDGDVGLLYGGITIYKHLLFAASNTESKIDVFRLDRSERYKQITYPRDHVISDVRMYAPELQSPLQSPCEHARCQHLCVGDSNNLRAQCVCSDGFRLHSDGYSCIGEGSFGDYTYVYVAGSQLCHVDVFSVFSAEPADSKCVTLGDGLGPIGSSAFHWDSHSILLADPGTKSIRRVFLEDGSIRSIVTGVQSVTGLAIDWTTGHTNLYWTNGEAGQLTVLSLEDGFSKVLLNGLENPEYIVISPKTRSIYWVGGTTSIYVSDLDGNNKRTFLHPEAMHDPRHLMMDYSTGRLFWINARNGIIYSSDTSGQQANPIIELTLDYIVDFTGFGIFKDFLIWMSGDTPATLHIRNLIDDVDYPRTDVIGNADDILVYGKSLQSDWPSPCSHNNGDCDHFCFHKPGGSRLCVCGEGFTLNSDGLKCSRDLGADMTSTTDSEPPSLALYIGVGAGALVLLVVTVTTVVCVKRKKREREAVARRRSSSQAYIWQAAAKRPEYNMDPSVGNKAHFDDNATSAHREVYDEIDEFAVGKSVPDYMTTEDLGKRCEPLEPEPDYYNQDPWTTRVSCPGTGHPGVGNTDAGESPYLSAHRLRAQPNTYIVS